VEIERGEGKPVGIVVSPDGRRIYVANGFASVVTVLDARTMRPIARIPVGRRPWGIALTRDGTRLYAACGLADELDVIDTRTSRVVARVSVGKKPWGVAIAQAPSR
jgi:YVTN family beta-propeller protein